MKQGSLNKCVNKTCQYAVQVLAFCLFEKNELNYYNYQ